MNNNRETELEGLLLESYRVLAHVFDANGGNGMSDAQTVAWAAGVSDLMDRVESAIDTR